MQTTIRKAVECKGIGLHTGEKTRLFLEPAPPDTGIVFKKMDAKDVSGIRVNLKESNVEVKRGTVLVGNGVKFFTVEHVLSAIVGMGIDNIIVEIDGVEPPAVDGSSRPFVDMIEDAGIKVQDKPAHYIDIDSPVWVDNGSSVIVALPNRGLRVSYVIDYYHPLVGTQFVSHVMEPELYKNRIAPARTFGFAYEVDSLYEDGLAKGGSLENAVIIGEYNILNPEGLRFKDEFVRHKVLDLLGDIAFLGGRLNAHILVMKGGHALHLELVREILDRGYRK